MGSVFERARLCRHSPVAIKSPSLELRYEFAPAPEHLDCAPAALPVCQEALRRSSAFFSHIMCNSGSARRLIVSVSHCRAWIWA